MLAEKLREHGVVGAGGAGFPTYVKAQARVECMIANGAECEPLIHKDVELMQTFPEEILAGLQRMARAVEARRVIFAIKEKNTRALEAIRSHARDGNLEIVLLGDFYPSGDEYEVVYLATGRLIPPAGLPLQVGCVVNNVETLYNVHRAEQGHPVTDKFLSVSGAVRRPSAFWAPVGVSLREVIEQAGGATEPDPAVFVSGIMMGQLCFDLEEVVTKTTAGLIVLPRRHPLVVRKSLPVEAQNRIGKSACDQCSYCTEFCPRYLLGYEVMPHKVMRSLGFTASGSRFWNQWGALCCACGLCTLYACPEDLFPKEACDQAKADLRAAGIRFQQQAPVRVHPMKEARRVPQTLLRRRLQVEAYESETPYRDVRWQPERVRILLSQHAGKPAIPTVRVGEAVDRGTVVGRVPEGELGANVHASIRGRVTEVTESYVEIRA
ncbi:MAG: SLBB domain-containing protein [Bryobacterales bacterium]|nr:SLBB domain-containing protein [Bryobacteraceae bacterium]MDW8131075.1 SLBB domain-containing protein [Bryobacterales bacterium]